MWLTLASYNIHACIGSDGKFDPQRTASVIRQLNADVIALQEVEHHQIDKEDLLAYLARLTGYQMVTGPTLLREDRHYGNALLTRLPVISSQSHDISHRHYEARGMIEARLQAGDQQLLVMATHLGLWPAERRAQVRQLLRVMQSQPADCKVLMGDLNEWLLWGRPLRWLNQLVAPTRHLPTFPAHWPVLALDRIRVVPAQHLKRLWVHKTNLARRASDHLPLLGQLQLNCD